MTVPPDRQCTLDGCEREATDPLHPAPLCAEHLNGLGDGEEARETAEDGEQGEESTDDGDTILQPSGETLFPAGLRERPYWVAWILDEVGRKRPVAPWKTGNAYPVEWSAELDDDERPETTHDEAIRWVEFNLADTGLALPDGAQSDELGIGIILPADRPPRDERVSLIDWDDVRDPETGAVHPTAARYIREIGGYVEVSQSGEGLHQLVYGYLPGQLGKIIRKIDDEPFVGDKRPGVEIYDGGRHVAMTGRHVEGAGRDLVEAQDAIDEIIDEFGSERDKQRARRNEYGEDTDNGKEGEGDADGDTRRRVNVSIGDAPDEYPRCYARALEARADPERADYATNHELNLHAVLLGAVAGYDVDELVDDFREFPLGGDPESFDEGTTRKAAKDTKRKVENGELAPPSVRTLREQGVLDDEGCSCHVHSRTAHSGEQGDETAGDEFGAPGDEHRDDPNVADVVLEPRRAWQAAERVTVDDLPDDHGLEPEIVDTYGVVRAAAVDGGLIDEADERLDDVYAAAYARARDVHGAPMPEYLTRADAVERFDAAIGAVWALEFWHLDRDALTCEITGEGLEVGGEAVLTLDPTPCDGWRDSDSGDSVVVYPSGRIFDAGANGGEGGAIRSTLHFVAADAGIVDDPHARLEGEAFTEAYRTAREQYGANLPRWNAGTPEHTPVLPAADELVETPDALEADGDELAATWGEVEKLYRKAAKNHGTASLLTVLPALGKTTAAIKAAADGIPTTYLAGRKDLMKQAAEEADEWGATYLHLPVFGGAPDESVVRAGVEIALEQGKRATLRDRDELLEAVDGPVFPEGKGDDEGGDDELERAVCSTAAGEHGDAWALAAHVAYALDNTPRDIHEKDRALFGEPLPCQHGDDCPYSKGWERVIKNDVDLLIGHHTLAHVESVRTRYIQQADGTVQRKPRTVVLDEFVGDTYVDTFGPEAVDHAVWLARALHPDVDDHHDLREVDVWGDEFVRAWLDGETTADDGPAYALDRALGAVFDAADAADAAADLLGHPTLEKVGLTGTLRRVANHPDGDEWGELADEILAATDADARDEYAEFLWWVADDVGEPLARAAAAGAGVDARELADDVLPVGGELHEFVTAALEAVDDEKGWATGMLESARTAVAGGAEGARELAVWADDGYAHRDAHYLLEAVVRPGKDGESRIATESYFADERGEGANVKRVRTDDDTVVMLARNDRGAEILAPPTWKDGGGGDVPVVCLDATGRPELWRVAIGRDVVARDVHETPAERRRFLRDVHGLQVVRAADEVRSYEGDPETKDLDGDVAMLERISEQYAGVYAGRDRDGGGITVDDPAVITTKCVREVLENDERAAAVTSTWENYGNVTGSNELKDHRLAAILGTQHYGDHEVERFAAFAGEEIDRRGWGAELDYGSDVANEYLGLMREDQTMQAILRFTRGESGAVVFARTAALRDDLPVVGDAQVVKSWSATATAVAREWRRYVRTGERFTAADVADAVDVTTRQVRRVLAEFVEAGYLERHETKNGVANQYTPLDEPGAGEVDLPDVEIDAEPGQSPHSVYYTGNVRVFDVDSPNRGRLRRPGSVLPAPGVTAGGDAPPDGGGGAPGMGQ